MTELILCSVDNGIARLTLNRPDKLNSFTAALHAQLRDAIDELESQPNIRALVLQAAGKGFCAGQDLNERVRPAGAPAVDLGDTLARDVNPMIERVRALPFPVIAAVNGIAAGAGASLALTADLVVAARSAKFSFSFARIGLIPDGGVSWILPRLVGPARAAGLTLLGETISASEAAQWGLIWKVVEDGDLVAETERLATFFSRQPTAALAATKRALRASWSNDLSGQLEFERLEQRERGFSEDYREGVTAFMERRPPQFRP